MDEETERKVAVALLDEVRSKTEEFLGGQIASPLIQGAEHVSQVSRIASFCKEMVAQCEIADSKAHGDREILIRSHVLKAQLYGNWQKIQGIRGTHKKAAQYYEETLNLIRPLDDSKLEAEIRYRYALFCRVSGVGGGKEKAIQNFEKVIGLVGTESELGLECAKELAKEKSTKGKACFVATAVFEDANAHEVEVLRRFRDEVLFSKSIGRSLIRVYYRIGPMLAALIGRSPSLKFPLRILFTHLVALIRSCQHSPVESTAEGSGLHARRGSS